MPITLKHFNGDKEAYKQYFRDLQKKSRENYKGTGGFKKGEFAQQMGKKGAMKRWGKNEDQKDGQST